MEGTGSWGPVQGGDSGITGEVDWRAQLQPDARQRIVNKITDTLQKHLPMSGLGGLDELQRIAVRFEEKIFTAAADQADYLRRISMKMLTMEQKTQGNTGAAQLPTSSNTAGQNPADQGTATDQANILSSHVRNRLSMPSSVVNQPPRLVPQNPQNNTTSAPMTGPSGMSTTLSSLTALTPSSIANLGQNQNMQVIPNISQNNASNTPGQGGQLSMYPNNSQRQMQIRHHQQSMISHQPQQQQQLQNQILYPQQLIKQTIHQSPILQSQIPQHQQQQSMLQTNQLQSSQQSFVQKSSGLQSSQNSQSSMLHSVSQSGLQQSQQNSVQQSTSSLHQQHPQSLVRQQPKQSQQSSIHQQNSLVQQATSITQQSPVLSSQQQQIMGHQSNISNIQHSQLLGQQNNITDMQQHTQHQRMQSQQNGLVNMQQSQKILNQQNITLNQQQQPTSQSNLPGLQQQQSLQHQPQMLVSQAAVSNMQHQQSMHILSHTKAGGQVPQTSSALLQLQGQLKQVHASQTQHIPQNQQHLQQQIGMQQSQQLQQRLQASSALLQSQNAGEQQKHPFQTQRGILPDVPSSSVDSSAQTGIDWQEECYIKIKSMKELYYAELQEVSQKLGGKIHLQESALHPTTDPNPMDGLKRYKLMVDRTLMVLKFTKDNVYFGLKEKLPLYEKQINNILNRIRNGQQQVHLGGQTLGTSQPPSQSSQMQQVDNELNQIQATGFAASNTSNHSTSISNMQSVSTPLSTQPGVSSIQQNMMSSLSHSSNLETPNSLGSMHQPVITSLNTTHQNNINSSVQNNASSLHSNMSTLQANTNVLQHQIKQEHQQQFIQGKTLNFSKMQQQMLQQKHPNFQQQLQQQQKQQPFVPLQGHQIQQLHQMNEINELKMRQGIKPGLFQAHYPATQRQSYIQHFNLPPSVSVSSPQNVPVLSPQLSQHSSPQVDQQVLSSVPKTGAHMQSINPHFIPSPSTPLAPSPLTLDNEKQLSSVTTLSNAGNIIGHQSGHLPGQPQSLAIGTPGISASPLLAEFTGVDGNQANTSAIVPGKSSGIEQPLHRLIKALRSSSSHGLASFANDIGSVVSLVDRIAGSTHGNGSRAAVGEDLVATTKCRMQARNFMQKDGAATKKMKRQISAMPLNVGSSAGSVHDSIRQSSIDTSELESTATSRVKRHKMEPNHALLEEIRCINQQLIDTFVDVTDEDIDSTNATAQGQGTTVKCIYSGIALSRSLKLQFASAKVSPILPLRLLIPANYPYRSPVILDKIPIEASKESEDISIKAKSRFSVSLRGLTQPMSLKEMATLWDICARKVISEFAQQSGGGTFSSRYGTWEKCVST